MKIHKSDDLDYEIWQRQTIEEIIHISNRLEHNNLQTEVNSKGIESIRKAVREIRIHQELLKTR